TSHRDHLIVYPFPTRRSSDLDKEVRGTVVRLDLVGVERLVGRVAEAQQLGDGPGAKVLRRGDADVADAIVEITEVAPVVFAQRIDRKSTRLNSSHVSTSYAVF